MKLKKYQKHSLIILLLPVLSFIIARITEPYRFSTYRYIYLAGVFFVYISWLIIFLLGIINTIEIILHTKENHKLKILWSIISLLPIIYIAIMMSIAMLK